MCGAAIEIRRVTTVSRERAQTRIQLIAVIAQKAAPRMMMQPWFTAMNGDPMKYVIALVCACFSVPAAAQTMASFRGDAVHSGIYAQPGVSLLHGIKWKFKTGGAVISTPAVLDGAAYFGSSDHFLYAVNIADGTQRWKFKTGSKVTSSPAVYQGHVYFGSYDGNIYSLDAKSGEQRWKFASCSTRSAASSSTSC